MRGSRTAYSRSTTMFAATTNDGDDHRFVGVGDRLYRHAAEAEDLFGDDDAAKEGGHVDAELGDHRDHGGPQAVAVRHPALPHALRPRSADAVLTEHLGQLSPRSRGLHGRRFLPLPHSGIRRRREPSGMLCPVTMDRPKASRPEHR